LFEGLAALSNGFDSAQVPPRPTLMVGGGALLAAAAAAAAENFSEKKAHRLSQF
jgi:hypothetical protein